MTTQCEPPVTGNDGADQKQSGEAQSDTAVHEGSPFPAAQNPAISNETTSQSGSYEHKTISLIERSAAKAKRHHGLIKNPSKINFDVFLTSIKILILSD
ncbi:hypothetical protein D9M72_617680 [compost metagenome]